MKTLSAFGSTVLLTAVSLFAQGARFVFQVLLSRMVDPQVIGLYHLVMPVMPVLMSLTALGFTAACSNLSARYHVMGDRKAAAQTVRVCIAGFLISFAVTALVTGLLSDAISVYLLGDARARLGLLLLLPCVLLTGLENIHKHFFYGIGDVRGPAFTEVGEQLIRTGAVLGLLWRFLPQNPERTVGLIVLGMILCEVFSALTLSLLYRRTMGTRPVGVGVERRELWGKVIAFAWPMALTALLGNLMEAGTTVLIPQRLIRAGADVKAAMSAFGILRGMTIPMLSLPTAVIGALSLILLPKMAEAHALGRPQLCRHRCGKALAATAALIFPAAALMAVAAPTLGRALFHEPTAGSFALPLAIGVALASIERVLGVTLNGLGRQKTTAGHSLITGAVQLFLTWRQMALPGMGLRGYVQALLLSTVLGVALNWYSLRRAIGLRVQWFRWIVAPGLGALLAGLCANLLLPILSRAGLGDGVACGVTLCFGGAVYLSAMAAMGWHLEESKG